MSSRPEEFYIRENRKPSKFRVMICDGGSSLEERVTLVKQDVEGGRWPECWVMVWPWGLEGKQQLVLQSYVENKLKTELKPDLGINISMVSVE